jgi:dTDP-glucose pyrophosphorylase
MNTPRWKNTLVPLDSTIQDVIRNLDSSALQIALVISADGMLEGSVTDGDIRRGLLRGLDLRSPVKEIIHRDVFVAPPEMSREVVLGLMRANKLRQVPIVDSSRRVVGLHLWDEVAIPSGRDATMVVMAGGFGTRLRPHTETCPKPLLPVGGKPILEHIVERARADGFRRFIFAVHYLGHMIREHFGDGSDWQVEIDYIEENKPLGTAGALGLLKSVPESAFVVSNGDVLTDVRYGELLEFHARNAATATMSVRQHEWRHPYGVVHTRGVEILSFEEKPVSRTYINAGIYALEPRVLESLVPGERCDMPTLFERLQKGGLRTIVYPMHEPWLDVGRPDDYALAQSQNQREET